jgi:hypothetical protein
VPCVPGGVADSVPILSKWGSEAFVPPEVG